MQLPISSTELDERIRLNRQRLADSDYYRIDEVFHGTEDWYGDKEGRALLAFVSHYKINGERIPCLDRMLQQIDAHLNAEGYFGPVFAPEIHEQQLSGHSWMLRGLCEYNEQFGDEHSLALLRRITENLYLPLTERISSYPAYRLVTGVGAVDGHSTETIDGWILSSDVACTFMSIDGLSHVYCVTDDERVKRLLDTMIAAFRAIDKRSIRAQIHCVLTAARGMMRLYAKTGDVSYRDHAEEVFLLYEQHGMTATYQNINWWGRPDSWTEPCAIVDSLMLATQLYHATGNAHYRTLAARIFHNGLATAQRSNGGAGTDTVVREDGKTALYSQMYEAVFCCTMRLAEGLWFIAENREDLYAEVNGKVEKHGRLYADGDILYAEVTGGAGNYAEATVQLDGHTLCPIVKYYRVPREQMESSRQQILF